MEPRPYLPSIKRNSGLHGRRLHRGNGNICPSTFQGTGARV